ncbi:MAG: VOC family protein [Pseudomonadales bacterium]|mgnify:CR=1 FL=1|jgi:hypothetical protein|nr:VOC family protein [Pseudomonadales bacterium]MDP6469724.1 VOC family protein [Pseudomonadales bacterium]MDP6827675.1 VOC family protein [Pseudomonadales bacterium]MDP6971885.1 VOC family protein [Pseudomonadales bacterium]|tara:strand:+ start:3147 stop:3794 length:648 start_codon:yes stop_codon:yes gene_type:complete
MVLRVDHFMYAVPSLDEGIEWAGDTFGIAPAYGGEHIGMGTRNALLSLDEAYLEIIAPDPAQPHEGTLAERFATLSCGGLVTWAAEGDLARTAASLSSCGVTTVGPHRTQRKTTEGELLVWELLFPSGSPHGSRMPFFIDWLECTNPRLTNPAGGQFQSLSITTPNAADLHRTLAAIALEVPVLEGEPALAVSITARGGDVLLNSTDETSDLTMR